MWRRILILTTFVSGLSTMGANLPAHQSQQRVFNKPNIVLIIMDDLGYGDIFFRHYQGDVISEAPLSLPQASRLRIWPWLSPGDKLAAARNPVATVIRYLSSYEVEQG